MQTEAQLQAWFKKQCKARGILFYKFASPSTRGVPDVLLVFPGGAVVFVELKTPKGTGKLSALQLHRISELTKQGATVYVCDSQDELLRIIETRSSRGD